MEVVEAEGGTSWIPSEGGSFNDRGGRIFEIPCQLTYMEVCWEDPLGVINVALWSGACKCHVADASFVKVAWKFDGEQKSVAALVLRHDGSAVAHHDSVDAPEFCMAKDVIGPCRQRDGAVDIENLDSMMKNVPEEVVAVPGACTCMLRPEINIFA